MRKNENIAVLEEDELDKRETTAIAKKTVTTRPPREVLGRLMDRFGSLVDVPFRVELWDGTSYRFGGEGEPAFRIIANNKRGLMALKSLSEIKMCECYMAGDLDLEGDILRIFDLRRLMKAGNPLLDFWRRLRPVFWGQQREDKEAISEHYEYDDDFYLYFLDETRTYSQGVYESDDETLETAMQRKLDFAIESCGLEPGMRVLDVGGGWGAFTEYAGKKEIDVTSLTISDHSFRFLNELIREQNLPCRALMSNFLDYESNKPYDAVVILGVIEHLPDYERVVRQLERLVKPGGRAYLDGSADRSKFVYNTFQNRYIYPGNHYMLSIHDFLGAVQQSGLELLTVLNDRYSYYLTTRAWAKKLDANKEEIVQRWGRELYRKFYLYLWGVAHNFLTNQIQAYRIVLQNNPPR
jgi:cyclopropane-fatty-acyl-phospholipid synthase